MLKFDAKNISMINHTFIKSTQKHTKIHWLNKKIHINENFIDFSSPFFFNFPFFVLYDIEKSFSLSFRITRHNSCFRNLLSTRTFSVFFHVFSFFFVVVMASKNQPDKEYIRAQSSRFSKLVVLVHSAFCRETIFPINFSQFFSLFFFFSS